jgi:hypothetical protein
VYINRQNGVVSLFANRFSGHKFYFLTTESEFVRFVWLSEQTEIITLSCTTSTHSLSQSRRNVYCAVQTERLNIVRVNLGL